MSDGTTRGQKGAHCPGARVAKGKGGPRDGVNQQAMPPAEQCAERRILWSRLVDATTEVYRAKNAYDFVKEKQVESLDALARVLQEATAVERAAELALKEHSDCILGMGARRPGNQTAKIATAPSEVLKPPKRTPIFG